MKSTVNFKNGLISLQQAERLYRKLLKSEKDFKDSVGVSNALQRTCKLWHNAIAFYEDVDLALRCKRRDFLLQYRAVPQVARKGKLLSKRGGFKTPE